MAEGFEPYHVPQQSRRDKLRILSGHQNQQPSAAAGVGQGLLPLIYDIPSTACGVKVENANLMAQIMAASSSSSNNHLYIDPPQLNPSSIEGFLNYNNTPHPPQGGLRFLHDQSFPLSVVTHESNNNNNSNRSGSGQALSLSLSSNNNHPTLPPQLDLNLQRYDINNSSIFTTPSKVITTGDVSGSRNSVPLGPFTGYASVLKGSRFLKPAQLLLEELCEVGRGISSFEKIEAADHYLFMDSPLESLCGTGIEDDPQTCTSNGSENRKKKSRLMSMLHEVCKRYKQYYQQMQAVVASFEAVAGVRNAAPFANLALKAMSKHFKYLKNTITDQLQFIIEPRSTQIAREKDSTTLCFDNPLMGIQNQRQLQNVGLVHDHHHQPVWRPQRGLPERAVTVLRAWLFEHFLHPYPTDTDKIMLAKQTGLSRNQVSNWFINARVRLWKPMVEEIHMLETRQAQKASHKEDQNADQRQNNAMLASTNRVSCEKKITSSQKVEDFPSKRTRSDLTAIQTRNEGDMNLLPYDNSSRHPCLNVGHVSTGAGAGAGAGAGGTGGVSLTLGLHQNNNGIGLGDTFPINAARRFGLDSNNDGYVIGGIDARNRQFGREVIGGQLLHDFVG